MPVSRNLSLPSSIEGRKFKKRPDGFADLHHCFSTPCTESAAPTAPSTFVVFHHAATPPATADAPPAPQPPQQQQHDSLAPPPPPPASGSSPSRGTLSQPCLSQPAVRATCIFPHLFLGSESDVSDSDLLAEQRIERVLNVSMTCERPVHMDDRHFRRIAVRDNYQERITPHLDDAVRFIEDARKSNERVLVHCVAGVSRSATVAIAYVMYYLRLSFEEAYRFVKEKRPTISPNFNFLGQLIEFEKTLRDAGHMTTSSSSTARKQPHDAEPPRRRAISTAAIQLQPPAPRPDIVVTSPAPSSLCRRRNAPVLDKSSFRGGGAATPRLLIPTPVFVAESGAGSAPPAMTKPAGAGVILDLRVSVPAAPSDAVHPRRLGSDGVEDERGAERRKILLPVSSPFDSGSSSRSTAKSNSLPRFHAKRDNDGEKRLATGLFRRRQLEAPAPTVVGKSATAPNTPVVLLGADAADPFSRDVEMTAQERPSPPSPKSAYATATSRGKNRSPKVMKRSFGHLRQSSYGYQAFLAAAKSTAGSSCARHDRRPHRAAPSCDSPSADRLSSLTLSSPAAPGANDDPMLYVSGTSCFRAQQQQDGAGGVNNHRASEPFKIVDSCELRARWRGNNKRRNSSACADGAEANGADDGGAVNDDEPAQNQQPSTPTSLGRRSVDMISCS